MGAHYTTKADVIEIVGGSSKEANVTDFNMTMGLEAIYGWLKEKGIDPPIVAGDNRLRFAQAYYVAWLHESYRLRDSDTVGGTLSQGTVISKSKRGVTELKHQDPTIFEDSRVNLKEKEDPGTWYIMAQRWKDAYVQDQVDAGIYEKRNIIYAAAKSHYAPNNPKKNWKRSENL